MSQEIQDQIVKGFEKLDESHARVLNEIKTTLESRMDQIEKKGFVDPETKEKLDRVQQHLDELDAKIAAPMDPIERINSRKSVGHEFVSSADYEEWKRRGFRKQDRMVFEVKGGFFVIPEQKTPLQTTNIGFATSGVQNYDRQSELIQLARPNLTVRDLLRVTATTASAVDYVKQNVATRLASPQTEGSAKAESTITYTTLTANVRTIAHFIQTSRQALDDITWLRGDLDSELMFGLKLKEEQEILFGDNLAEHLNGITPQASARVTTYDVAGDTKLDKIRHMILQARLAYYPVDGIVMNPRDLHDIELIKDENGGTNKGHYVIGDPKTGASVAMVWGKPVVESDSMTYGKPLVGSFAMGAQLFDRQQATIDISYEHSTNFTTNQVTILAEERLALAVKRAASFIYATSTI